MCFITGATRVSSVLSMWRHFFPTLPCNETSLPRPKTKPKAPCCFFTRRWRAPSVAHKQHSRGSEFDPTPATLVPAEKGAYPSVYVNDQGHFTDPTILCSTTTLHVGSHSQKILQSCPPDTRFFCPPRSLPLMPFEFNAHLATRRSISSNSAVIFLYVDSLSDRSSAKGTTGVSRPSSRNASSLAAAARPNSPKRSKCRAS